MKILRMPWLMEARWEIADQVHLLRKVEAVPKRMASLKEEYDNCAIKYISKIIERNAAEFSEINIFALSISYL